MSYWRKQCHPKGRLRFQEGAAKHETRNLHLTLTLAPKTRSFFSGFILSGWKTKKLQQKHICATLLFGNSSKTSAYSVERRSSTRRIVRHCLLVKLKLKRTRSDAIFKIFAPSTPEPEEIVRRTFESLPQLFLSYASVSLKKSLFSVRFPACS